MIYVPIKHLKPGMILAQDVSFGRSLFSLLVMGQELTATSINKLKAHKIAGTYIQSRLCDDLEADTFLDYAYKQKTLAELTRIFDNFALHRLPNVESLKSILKLAQDLLMFVLSKDECLVNLMDIKEYDTYTYTHSMNVGILSVLIGIHQGYKYPQLMDLALCGLLHDIGKLDIPPAIVNKTSALTAEEFEIMKTHPANAVQRLRPYRLLGPAVLQGVVTHHEKYDGSGYPKGLVGDDIPIYGRILALADVYDALTSQRSYRRAWSSSEAVEFLMGSTDSHFDFELLQVFLKTVAAYPVGTLVELSNGYLAVVVANNQENTLRPLVRLLMPENVRGTEVNLISDTLYLNVTVEGTVGDDTPLPNELFL